MAGPSTTRRALGILILLACLGVAGLGVWYVRGGGLGHGDDITADDDDDTPDLADGGATAHHKPKKPGRRAGKAKGGHRPSAPPSPPPVDGPGPSGVSYEAAIAGNNLQLTPGTKDAPDLTDVQLGGPMRNGTFLDTCGVPESVHVVVKVAIRGGHAVGVSVYPSPPSAPLAGCIERQVRGLHWPSSAKMDSFVTTY